MVRLVNVPIEGLGVQKSVGVIEENFSQKYADDKIANQFCDWRQRSINAQRRWMLEE
jgi:hypothetical protein